MSLTLPQDTTTTTTNSSYTDIQSQALSLSQAANTFSAAATTTAVGDTQVIKPTDPELGIPWIIASQVTDYSNSTNILQRAFHRLTFDYKYTIAINNSPDSKYNTTALYCVSAGFTDTVYASNGDFIRWAQTPLSYKYTKLFKHVKVGSTAFIEKPLSINDSSTGTDTTKTTNALSGGTDQSYNPDTGLTKTTANSKVPKTYHYQSAKHMMLVFRTGGIYPGAVITTNAPTWVYLAKSPGTYVNPTNSTTAPPATGAQIGSNGTALTSTGVKITYKRNISGEDIVAPTDATGVVALGGTYMTPAVSSAILLSQAYLLVYVDVTDLVGPLQVTVDWYGQYYYTQVASQNTSPQKTVLRHTADTPYTSRLLPPGDSSWCRVDFPAAVSGVSVDWGSETSDAGLV